MADIVKLIYKGDTMSQWGGGGSSSPFEVLTLTWTSDTTWAQAILDSVLAGNYVIIRYTKSNTQDIFYQLDSHTKTWSATRLRFRKINLNTGSWTGTLVWDQWVETFIQAWLTINYSWTTVTTIEEGSPNQWTVPGYYE